MFVAEERFRVFISRIIQANQKKSWIGRIVAIVSFVGVVIGIYWFVQTRITVMPQTLLVSSDPFSDPVRCSQQR